MSNCLPEINYLKLKEARELAGISQADLANSLCLGKAHIEQMESNLSDIYFSPIHKIQVAKKIGHKLNLNEDVYLNDPVSIASLMKDHSMTRQSLLDDSPNHQSEPHKDQEDGGVPLWKKALGILVLLSLAIFFTLALY